MIIDERIKQKLKNILINGKLPPRFINNLSKYFDETEIAILKQNEPIIEYLYKLYTSSKGTCIVCDNTVKFYGFSKGYSKTCSPRCKTKATKQTNLEKYGVENPAQSEQIKDKIKQTNLKKYGNVCSLHGDEIKQKTIKTNLEKYGVPHNFMAKVCQENCKQTNLKKYGVENPAQSEQIKDKIKQTNLKKYGVENPTQSEQIKDKIKQTNLKKYGVENPTSLRFVIEKRKQTSLEKYGVENPAQSEQIKDKIKQTNLKKYGVKWTTQSQKVKDKRIQTNLEKYGVENPAQSEQIKDKIKQTNQNRFARNSITQQHITNYENWNIQFIEDNFVKNNRLLIKSIQEYFNISSPATIYSLLKNSNKKWKCITIAQEEINNTFNNIFEINTRGVITPKEIDLYSEQYKLAIEFDGLMYHSNGKSKYEKFNKTIDKNYHLNKTKLCEEKGIHLLHIFENEWMDQIKQDIWKSIISGKLGKNERIFARKCTTINITNEEARKFCEENHLQGYINSSIRYGLIYENKLVSIMTFSKSRYNKNYQWELTRFCSLKNTSVIGGASKLLNNFKKKYRGNIITYADRRYSNGGLYRKLGGTLIGTTPPNYFYFSPKDYILQSRLKFQKHKLKKQLKKFNPELTEKENMIDNGYRIIYDCGNLIYKI